MEEWVGEVWHKFITRAADREHHQAVVALEDVRNTAGTVFRAMGGSPGLRVEPATETAHGARRRILSRLAGSDKAVELAWRDEETLRLPIRIAQFADADLNRELYLWLSALAAQARTGKRTGIAGWLIDNAMATAGLIEDYPGVRARYLRLVRAHLRQRRTKERLRPDERKLEEAIRNTLSAPGRVQEFVVNLPECEGVNPQPVPLFLHPAPPVKDCIVMSSQDSSGDSGGAPAEDVEVSKRRRGEYVEEPDSRSGLLAFRLESLFTRTEFAAVDRTQEENEDPDAKSGIEDLDVLSVSRQRDAGSSRLRFDLDLPSVDYDDIRLGGGIPLPEWNYRKQLLVPDHCRLQLMTAREPCGEGLPPRLKTQAKRLRNQFEALRPRRIWQSGQLDGSELDLPAVVRRKTDLYNGMASSEAPIYRDFRNLERDLSCLVLADLSLSTDAHVDNEKRVIDVIRDSLHLLAEALSGTGDRHAMYGFSSRYRDHVRMHVLKAFEEKSMRGIHGRIAAITPGYYTRMGAAVRYSTTLLEREASSRKLMLLLTDGKPNDLDKYEGRYGVEDTRMAIRAAAKEGIHTFCVTVDRKAGDYLPYLFGHDGWLLLKDARKLPEKLPMLYARLTA